MPKYKSEKIGDCTITPFYGISISQADIEALGRGEVVEKSLYADPGEPRTPVQLIPKGYAGPRFLKGDS